MTHFKDVFTFTWEIENFSMLPHQMGKKLESPVFVVETLNSTKWNLRLYQKGKGSDNYLSLYLGRVDFDINRTASNIGNILGIIESADLATVKSGYSINSKFQRVFKGFPAFMHLHVILDSKNLYLPLDVLTIRCYILPSQEKYNASEIMNSSTLSDYFKNRCSARTTIGVQRRVLSWPITKISKLVKSKEKISIDFGNSLEDSPLLKLSFCVDKTLNDMHSRIEILRTRSSSENGLLVKCTITVVTSEKHLTSGEDSHFFSSDLDEIWHFPDFILIDRIEKEYAYVEDTMFLHCVFTFSNLSSVYHSELPMYIPDSFQEKESTESTHLSQRIRGLFVKGKFCDVEIRAGAKTFPCHKLVICAQSPVFTAMFENDMKEKETGVIDITDLDPQTLERMLNFLYLEVVQDGLSVQDVCELYSAADKYEVVLLQRRCSLLLLSKLSVASVCSVLVTAVTHQDNFLLKHVLSFLAIHSRRVFHSTQWKTFMVDYPTLARETMIKICMEDLF